MQLLDLSVFFILVLKTENIRINTEVMDTELTECAYIMYNILHSIRHFFATTLQTIDGIFWNKQKDPGWLPKSHFKVSKLSEGNFRQNVGSGYWKKLLFIMADDAGDWWRRGNHTDVMQIEGREKV